MGKRTFRIRPFGLIGSPYEVDRIGFVAFQAALLCVPAGIVAEAYARNNDTQLQAPIAVVVTIAAAIGITVAVLRGKKVE